MSAIQRPGVDDRVSCLTKQAAREEKFPRGPEDFPTRPDAGAQPREQARAMRPAMEMGS